MNQVLDAGHCIASITPRATDTSPDATLQPQLGNCRTIDPNEHRHSAIWYVTPDQRHTGADIAILAHRRALYEHARRRIPGRWSGKIRNWAPVAAVVLNPEPTVEVLHAAS
jgi:hypothetical protein